MEFAISQPKMVRLPRNKKQTYRLNSWPQMWPSGLTLIMTLIFQGQIYNLLYLSPKWSDCQETKSKHIDWTLGLKCYHQVWPWQWPWSLNSQGQMWPRPLTIHTHGDDQEFSWSNFEIAVSQDGRADWHWTKRVAMTIWWPRSGVRIYHIVTGVTSYVGVPLTRLVDHDNWT